jgi:hypothetical protein
MKRIAILAALSALAACDKPAPDAPSSPAPAAQAPTSGELQLQGRQRKLHYTLQLNPPSPRVGELFTVETRVADPATGAPVTGLDLKVDATMPDHRHGMMTRPLHKELGQGRYLSEGMKLHMSGRWELRVDAHAAEGDDVATIDWHQSPIAAPDSQPGSQPGSQPDSQPGSQPDSQSGSQPAPKE